MQGYGNQAEERENSHRPADAEGRLEMSQIVKEAKRADKSAAPGCVYLGLQLQDVPAKQRPIENNIGVQCDEYSDRQAQECKNMAAYRG